MNYEKQTKVDLEEAKRFLETLDMSGIFTFQVFSDGKDKKINPKILHGTLEDHAEELAELNQQGCGIFVTINKTNGKGRKASDIIRVRAHFVDSDHEPYSGPRNPDNSLKW